MEGVIQFMANYEEWKSIRKITVTEKTAPKTIMEFLASLTNSVDGKVESNLRKIVELDKVDKAIDELQLGKKEVGRALEEVNSRKISSVINEITKLPELQKNEQKEIQGFCRVYAMKKALKACGLEVDYTQIEIPGMGRLKKKKVEKIKE